MARRTIQAPILRMMLQANRPVKRAELHEVIGGSTSSLSGALTRLAGNGVVQRNDDGTWIITNPTEADWLTKHTYHTKNRKEASADITDSHYQTMHDAQVPKAATPRVVGVMKSPNGELKMGDLFELIGRLPDGSKLVRTLDEGTVYKLEEV